MDQQFDFRALLVKLQDCLSDNDRRRLHFIVGDTIPRQLRDDPTLGGTLSLLESLFDQAKISEQDFDYLINVFQEIHCYEAVKRLKEHQLGQNLQQNRTATVSSHVSDLLNDNEIDRINPTKFYPNAASSDSPAASYESRTTNNEEIGLTKKSIRSENKHSIINKIDCKQCLKSRLTTCQLFLLIANIIGILTFIILIIVFAKTKHRRSDILVIKTGSYNGNPVGGQEFNDAVVCSLTFQDKIERIVTGYTSDMLNYLTLYYSNGRSNKHGQQTTQDPLTTATFTLNSDESINGVTLYTGERLINNPYSPNGSFIIVGIRFYTTQGRESPLYGSNNGTEVAEVLTDFTITYARGRSLGYVDALQFIWYKKTAATDSALLPTYEY